MGDPKKTKKHYESPRKPWDKGRLEREKALKNTYGFKNKKELWRTETMLRKKRINARKLLALPLEERKKREKELLDSLERIGLLTGNATLDDVLSLTVESLLERRLQTMVWRKGLANTPKQARQFITHGHIAVSDAKVDAPGYLVTKNDEDGIEYFGEEMYLGEKVKPKATADEKKKMFEEAAGKEAGAKEKDGAKDAEVNAEDENKDAGGKEKSGKVEAVAEDTAEAKPEKAEKIEGKREKVEVATTTGETEKPGDK